MHATILFPLAVTIAGGLVYFLTGGKWQELGRLAFAVGLFYALASVAGSVLHVG